MYPNLKRLTTLKRRGSSWTSYRGNTRTISCRYPNQKHLVGQEVDEGSEPLMRMKKDEGDSSFHYKRGKRREVIVLRKFLIYKSILFLGWIVSDGDFVDTCLRINGRTLPLLFYVRPTLFVIELCNRIG